MKRISAALLATAIASPMLIATPAMAAVDVSVVSQGPVAEIQVQQDVLGDPDKAIVSAGVTSRAQTAVAAMQQNATAMDKVLKRLDALKIPRERVQTSGISLNPQYNYNNGRVPTFLGYDATNTVTVELRDLDNIGPVLDWLVSEGANNINGPTWGVIDDTTRRDQARKAAMTRAFAQARDYARMAGYSDVKLLSVEETMGFTQPFYGAPPPAPPPIATEAKSTPTRPGQVSTTVTLNTKFELVR